ARPMGRVGDARAPDALARHVRPGAAGITVEILVHVELEVIIAEIREGLRIAGLSRPAMRARPTRPRHLYPVPHTGGADGVGSGLRISRPFGGRDTVRLVHEA